MSSRSRENDEFISLAIFSNGGDLEFSTRLNFTILKPWSLIMQHMKFKIHGCSGEEDKSFEWTLNGLKCRVNVNFARVDVNFQTATVT